jgi:hypothetical protein
LPDEDSVGTGTARFPLSTHVVGTGLPLKVTDDAGVKPLPFRVSVKGGPLMLTAEGLRLVRTGTGLVTVNVADELVPPPGAGFVTVMACVPPVAVLLPSMVA